MRPIEPQQDTWVESGIEYGPPAWQLVRGLSRGGLVYEHRDGAVVHLHDDGEGFLEVATWDPTDEFVVPDSEALREIVNADVERMAATPAGRATTHGGGGIGDGCRAAFGRSTATLVRPRTLRPGM